MEGWAVTESTGGSGLRVGPGVAVRWLRAVSLCPPAPTRSSVLVFKSRYGDGGKGVRAGRRAAARRTLEFLRRETFGVARRRRSC